LINILSYFALTTDFHTRMPVVAPCQIQKIFAGGWKWSRKRRRSH